MILAAWVHDLSPVIVRLWGDLALRWYGAAYAAGFVLAYVIVRWLAKRGATTIPRAHAGDAIVAAALGVIAGGRLGYVLLYKPSLLWTFERGFPWWGVLDIAGGGMASHGGMVGVILAAVWIARGYRDVDGGRVGSSSPRHVMDVMALVAPAGLFLGRLANFVNGELLGRIVARPGEPGPWWSVRFPQERLGAALHPGDDSGHIPVLTRHALGELSRLIDGYTLAGESPDRGYDRLVERIRAGSADAARDLAPFLSARHPSQLYQAVAEGLVVGAVVWAVARRPRAPGVVGCWFLMSYGVLRVVTEYWRLPDAHLSVERVLGLSRGQWLSLLMVAAGAGILRWIVGRGGPAMGGWGRGPRGYDPPVRGSGPRPGGPAPPEESGRPPTDERAHP